MSIVTKDFLLFIGFEEGCAGPKNEKTGRCDWVARSDTDQFRLDIPGEGYGRMLYAFLDDEDDEQSIQISFSSFGMACAPIMNRNVTQDRLTRLIALLKECG